MAAQTFDQYADLGKLTKETDLIIKEFTRVEQGIVKLNQLGFTIDSSKSIAATAKAASDLEKIQQQLIQAQGKMDAQVERSRALSAKAGEAEAKQKLAEIKLREANEKAIERERLALEKKNNAEASAKASANTLVNNEARIQAIKDEEQAQIEYAKSIQETLRTQYELDAAIESAGANKNQRAQLKPVVDENDVKNVKEYADDVEQLTGTLNENLKQQQQYKKDIGAIGAQLKDLDKNTSAATKTTDAYKNKVAQLQGTQQGLKKDSQDLATVIKAQTREQAAGANSLDQLRSKLILAQRAYDSLSEAERSSALGGRIQERVKQLSTQVNYLEQQTGRFGRNVGNYSNGIASFFSKAFSGLRQIAYLVPGLGMAGIIGAIVEGVISLTKEIVHFGSAASKAQGDLADAMQEASTEIGKQVGEVEALYKITQDTNQQLDDRKDATKRLLDINKENNEATGLHNKLLVDSNGILKDNKEAIDALTQSLFIQAKTKAYLSVIEKAYGSVIAAQNKELNKTTGTFKDIVNAFRFSGDIFSIFQGKSNPLTGILIGQAKAKTQGIEDAEAYLKNLQDSFAKGLASGELDLSGIFGKESTKGQKKAADKARKDALELFKYRMGLLIEEQKALSELPAITAKYRIQAREKQAELEKQLIRGVSLFELAEEGITADKRKLIRLKVVEDINKAEAEKAFGINSIRIATERQTLDDIASMEKEYQERVLKEQLEFERLRQKQIEDLRKSFEVKQTAGVNILDVDLAGLEQQLRDGLISYETYEAQKAKLIADANKKNLNDEIDYYIQLTLISNLSTDKQAEAIKKLQELRHKANQEDLKEAEDITYKKIELEKKRNQSIKDLGLQALDTIHSLLEGGVDAQKNKIQDQIDSIEALKSAEIDRINSTADSEEKKAARIKIVEAKAAADKENLNRRQKELDRRNAIFDRTFRAFSIATTGIENLAKVKASVIELTAKAAANPLLAPLIPIAAAQIPISIASTAAQLVALLATPIPKFAEGTDYSPAGKALVGEMGAELAVDKSGNLTYYDRATITDLTAGTKIYPADVTKDILSKGIGGLVKVVVDHTGVNEQDLSPEILKQLREINSRSRIYIHNETNIESTAWYQKHLKN
jgi:hypothetical protein